MAQVDLKDKWRNLMRVAVLPAAALRTKCAKRRELPLEVLVKVIQCTSFFFCFCMQCMRRMPDHSFDASACRYAP